MPSLTAPLAPEGAVVAARIGWSAASTQSTRAALRPVPPPVDVDCGAESSCVDTSVIQSLGLPVGGFVIVNVPAHRGLTFATQHDASLIILHSSGDARLNLTLNNLLVVDLAIGVLGYQALLGRDVLAGCRFLYDGPGGRFELTY